MDIVNLVHCLHPNIIDLVDLLNSEWESIPKFRIPVCDLFHCLLYFLWFFMIIPNYNSIYCFFLISLDKGLYRVLESLDVFFEHRPVLVI